MVVAKSGVGPRNYCFLLTALLGACRWFDAPPLKPTLQTDVTELAIVEIHQTSFQKFVPFCSFPGVPGSL